MKGYIAFCPHFHQPHFQLYNTRENVFKNSYEPWLNMLENAVNNYDDFYINIHLSGPFLYWIKNSKKDFLKRLKKVISTNKIGFIGGFCDEAFIQLSSRVDDIYFQLKEYGKLLFDTLGIKFEQWQGIHIPEREVGELLFSEVTKAAKMLHVTPLYYLDSETFYEDHYANVGSENDYCLKHLGFCDPVSKTTISRLPQDMLHFCFRDSIVNNDFYCFPMHSKYRYHFLKNNSFNEYDNVKISAEEYFKMIKKDIDNAYEYSLKCGKNIVPIVVIFEDAEKFGDWSKNPDMDTKWMNDFFKLVNEDKEISFIGLKDYFENNSFFDTYPVLTSRSYPEWENWTAKRGIRGVVYGDEHLRKTISRLQMIEKKQNYFERLIIDDLDFMQRNKMIKEIILNSNMCFSFIENYLLENYGKDFANKYTLVNRVRNVLYQEDSKWASRHPNYGSAPYFDNIGIPYLEIVSRVLDELIDSVCEKDKKDNVKVIDWDFDGEDEIFITNNLQTIGIDMRGACIDYHVVLNNKTSNKFDITSPYNSIYKQGMPLIFTETDSDLKKSLGELEERIEKCRNSYRCDIYVLENNEFRKIGDLGDELFELKEIKSSKNNVRIICEANIVIDDISFVVKKIFIVMEDNIEVSIEINSNLNKEINLFLVPQIVTSLTPSDEVGFKPSSNIGFEKGNYKLRVNVDQMINIKDEARSFCKCENLVDWSGNLNYEFEINTGERDKFINSIEISFDRPDLIEYMNVLPAVKNYYYGYVGDAQSNLGYDSSGIMFVPFVKFVNGKAKIKIITSWNFNVINKEEMTRIDLINYVK